MLAPNTAHTWQALCCIMRAIRFMACHAVPHTLVLTTALSYLTADAMLLCSWRSPQILSHSSHLSMSSSRDRRPGGVRPVASATALKRLHEISFAASTLHRSAAPKPPRSCAPRPQPSSSVVAAVGGRQYLRKIYVRGIFDSGRQRTTVCLTDSVKVVRKYRDWAAWQGGTGPATPFPGTPSKTAPRFNSARRKATNGVVYTPFVLSA